MTFKRLLPCAVALAFLVPAVPAAAQDLGGGATATPGEPVPQASADPATPAQTTPTTPGGEEQPPADELMPGPIDGTTEFAAVPAAKAASASNGAASNGSGDLEAAATS